MSADADVADEAQSGLADAPAQFGVAKGNPTDDELGAAMAVLTLVLAPPPPPRKNLDRGVAGGWKSYWRTVRDPFIPGRDSWEGSLR